MFRILERIPILIAWMQIAAAPALLGFAAAFFLFQYKKDNVGLILAIILALAGLFTGVLWARNVQKKRGAVDFMSAVNATPELNKEDGERT